MKPFKHTLHKIIFETDTPAGRLFDFCILTLIVVSVSAVILESVEAIHTAVGDFFLWIEWVVTIVFTIEYILRIYCAANRRRYISSFYGMVDLLSILPTYLSIFAEGTTYLLVIRDLRLLRIFRVLKLGRFLSEANVLMNALKASRAKITVFLGTVVMLVIIMGTLMYLIEGPPHGFTSIPRSIYWAVVTMTTVGYGDISPQTILGQALACLVMLLGYSIIAVPTGIVSAEMAQTFHKAKSAMACPHCAIEDHDMDAAHCKYCGARLELAG